MLTVPSILVIILVDTGNGSLTSSTKANSTSPENSSTLESHEFENGGITAATPENVGDLYRNSGCSNVDVFTYEEMRLATMHFQPAIVLGEGGFGIVYKGVIDESVRPGYETTNVGIKVLAPQGFQGERVAGKKVEEGGGFEVWEWQSAQGDWAGKRSLMCYGLAFREKIRKSGRTLLNSHAGSWKILMCEDGKQQHSFYALLDSLCILDIGTFLVRCGVGGSIRGDGTSPFVGRVDGCQEA
ncbi:hypothetical protein RHGRI_000919 [Rhododendron griersonianum]|uniref:Uncharacterized protein n=1 Tax=Rhododendron griersonianum TaxID=479676 RepID=A0AAV6LIC7_9ERIC|nr:hypothetical protein RHGRI_000919 [Rhododendron griersonianum]